ncbi:aldehyde dehydrogenase family protein [Rathayibacter sp. VKM Ac-2759]|uniref:aminobutyraldehyde dehydrogenase n=1 Tax=Rathayibacter sp. VKM Ac-2759 TaxID=2609252 RepID=UPI001316EC0F|nr:aminobutyraldehyde dehydrogenase [Rathayibacter sp. VKM Ac-2759]QHC68040.1 aldehyde dehydrogenase family protein [Rathayibacter sp. VKM Ac-2759]
MTAFTLAPAASATSEGRDFLPPYGHYVDGAFVDGSAADRLPVVDPATAETIAEVPAGTAADVDRAVAAARRAQREWGRTTPRSRSEVLHRIADVIEDNRAAFAALESLNTGKPAAVADDDIDSAIDTFRFMAGAARTLTSLAGGQYVTGNTSLILREPVGVVGVVTPWNYPLLMAAWKIAPILAGGNSIVLKPSEQTPLTTLKLAELVTGILPAGVLNVVVGLGPTVGRRIAEHPDIALVALTGSVGSGRAVAEAAASTLKRVHLELGGKAPVLVLPDADLAAVARGVRAAGFWNSGQECGAACRVIVHESVAEALTAELTREIGSLVVGPPEAGSDVEIGPLISKAHYERVLGFLERAEAAGATIAVGGHTFDSPGYFVAPTLLTGVAPDSEIATSEAFGPVVSVETYSDLPEAIERANATPYGLAASVWTADAAASLQIPTELDFGTVWVNAHLVLANEVPWGGFKGSGYGRDLSLYALDDFTRTKHVMLNHE